MGKFDQQAYNKIKNKKKAYDDIVDEVDRINRLLANYKFKEEYIADSSFQGSAEVQPAIMLKEKGVVLTANANKIRSHLASVANELAIIRTNALNYSSSCQTSMTNMVTSQTSRGNTSIK